MNIPGLQKACNNIYVMGLHGYTFSPAARSDTLASHFDIPLEFIDDLVDLHLPLPPDSVIPAGLKLINRYSLELFLHEKKYIGPKWAAIEYGISANSLKKIITEIGNKYPEMEDNCSEILNDFKLNLLNAEKLKSAVEFLLNTEGTPLYSNLTARTEDLDEICQKEFNLKLELAWDASIIWAKSIKNNLPYEQFIATSFCTITGLPVSLSYSEYLKSPKHGALEPDRVAWVQLAQGSKAISNLLLPSANERFLKFAKFLR